MSSGKVLSFEEKLKQGLIQPGTPFVLRQTIEASFADDTIAELKESARKIVLTESKQKVSTRKLLVTVEGIHTGMTKNRTFYPGTTLEESVPTWTTPHRKPVLKNHSSYTEPLGRIASAEYVESTLTDKYTVRLKLEIMDQDTIDKVLDGRYLTLSVGGSANRVNCSVCGKDLVNEGYCGHSRGRKYEGKEAYWTIGNYTGDEISFVNMPADIHAQVIQAELITGEGGKGMANGGQQAEHTEDLGVVDDILNNSTDGDENQDPPSQQQENTQDDNSDNGNTDNPKKTDESTETDAEKIARLEQALQEANDKISTHASELEVKEAEITALTADVTEAKDAEKTAKAHLESAESEKDTLTKQNVTLARLVRKSLAERVADLRILQGKDKVEARDQIISEWRDSSTKVLEGQIKDLLESAQRTVHTVPSPGLPITDNNSTIEDEDGNDISTNKQKNVKEAVELPTVKSFASKSRSMSL